MGPLFSPTLMDDVKHTIHAALTTNGIINIPKLAEEIRRRNEAENIALEDITAELLVQAQRHSAAIEFDCPSRAIQAAVI